MSSRYYNNQKVACAICDSPSRYSLDKDGYTLFKCERCGLVFVHPSPSEAYLKRKMYSKTSGYQKNKIKNLSETVPSRRDKKILDWLVVNRKGARILDVGCSSGEFLYHAGPRGFSVVGVEPNERTREIAVANGLDVRLGDLPSASFADAEFDVVYLGDVLEHARDPRSLIEETKRILKENGYIIISTPNLNSFWAKITLFLFQTLRIPWSSVAPPYHLFQFSMSNLNILMEKVGFKPKETWFERAPTIRYELWQTHLYGWYKKKKNIWRLSATLAAFSLYAGFYLLDILITPFKSRDFGMIIIYERF